MTFSEEQVFAIENLKKGYYKGDDIRRESEKRVSKEIIEFVIIQKEFTEKEILKIETFYNQITTQDHFNGSGWFDFKIRLASFLRSFSYDSNWDSKSDILTITKRT